MGADQSGLFQRRKARSSTMSPIRERSEVSTRQDIHETKQPIETTAKPQMTKGRVTMGDIHLENIDDDDDYVRPDTPRPELLPKLAPPTVNILPSDDVNNNDKDSRMEVGTIVSHAVSSRGSPSPPCVSEAPPPSLPLTPVSQRRITPRSSAGSSHKGEARQVTSNGGINLSDYLKPSTARIMTTTAGQVDEKHALPSVSV